MKPWVACGGVVAGVVALVGVRLARDGVQPYGTDAAQYIEHTARLETLALWREGAELGLWERLVSTDGAFPAGLHLLTLPWGGLLGRSAETAAASGVGWFLLLLGAVGACAAALFPPGTRRSGVPAVVAGTALVPSLHGIAGRYYYDLPMVSLLWVALAVLLWSRDRRPILGGAVAGLVGAVACLVKWAAIPYGAIAVAAALIGARRDEQRARPALRAVACALALGIPAWVSVAYIGDVVGTSSFGHQAHITVPAAEGTEVERGVLPGLLDALLRSAGGLDAARLAFHPVRAAVAVFSPLLFGIAVWLGARGVRSRLGLGAPLLLLLGGQLAFVVLLLPVLDDRFLLPLVPAATLLAGLGWVGLAPRRRARVAAVVAAVGALVAIDLHLLPPTFLTYPIEILEAREVGSPWTRARGVGAASSVELRGWARHDEADPARRALHDAVWDALAACERGLCVAAERGDGAIERYGDQEWLRYRGLLAAEEGGGPVTVITTCPTFNDRLPQDCTADFALEPLGEGDVPREPGCIDEGAWELHLAIPDPDGGRGVALWRKDGAAVCPLPSG